MLLFLENLAIFLDVALSGIAMVFGLVLMTRSKSKAMKLMVIYTFFNMIFAIFRSLEAKSLIEREWSLVLGEFPILRVFVICGSTFFLTWTIYQAVQETREPKSEIKLLATALETEPKTNSKDE